MTESELCIKCSCNTATMHRIDVRATSYSTPVLAPSLNEQDLGAPSKIRTAKQQPGATIAFPYVESNRKAASAGRHTPNDSLTDRDH